MTLIADTVKNAWFSGRRIRPTPSGWHSGDCVVCNDRRGRGGLLATDTGGIVYCCFNCNTRASWEPGRYVSKKMTQLMGHLGLSNDIISKLKLSAVKLLDQESRQQIKDAVPNFVFKPLPDNAEKLTDLIDSTNSNVRRIINYLKSRRLDVDQYPWYYSSATPTKLIIPFYYRDYIVGYTARSVINQKPKYISVQQPGYVFNLDQQHWDRKFVIVSEGVLDAVSISGVAVLHNTINEHQAYLINSLHRTVIVVPDRDPSGPQLVKDALDRNWAVSMPPWEPGIKDINDAVIKIGRLSTLHLILKHAEQNQLKIQLTSRQWFKT